ncbi:helix-turn-helix transcriptional regulator [Hymenobacter jejuensis]|uniref:Response regulator transcription factor n=1 Tax=Hymenobacter jejuensis TaxID=2502781 RepID=A0A5B7ZYE2_9BACT|nr:response regulator transcription factor [Hymenobacter jejuensis]QDA59907.1 response regulator transcription factor [Hymenobacter jejuensis]
MLTSFKAALIAAAPTLHRQGLLFTLRDTWPDLSITLTPDPARLPELLKAGGYNLAILDLPLLGPIPPVVLAHLRLLYPRVPMLLLTGQRLQPALRQHLTQTGYTLLCRHATTTEVVTAVHAILARNESPSSFPTAQPTGRREQPGTAFSVRELDVLRLVVADCCNREIADRLCLSVRTVESHRRALLQKAGAKTLVGLVVQAVREGWVSA